MTQSSRERSSQASDIECLATHHYFDREFNVKAIKLLPNEYYVSNEDMLLTTVLGSCIAACIRDPVVGVGGMNHFMLPDESGPSVQTGSASMRYGAYAMEVLINALLMAGAKRERLEAKVFGGATVLADMSVSRIGERNSEFILRYLELERIRVLAQDLKDKFPRRVNYLPHSGQVMVRRLKSSDSKLQSRESSLARNLAKSGKEKAPAIELFDSLSQIRSNRAKGVRS
ncbi:chemoreceptor glutamine deamidase CheD [Larsenimonas rhizosphaerae]|uniref:Probable chemoreceptor glutamine deamidase CheD n=1 Tax=Larsenimonas rhizosphaerae TaxID=2944682 RepID=A0AA41ZD38_9GAMM|nr:chemoreceptor glutamine deamidase CheD [Larsenimonas rhizosphaerae]MCM2130384.1 chemoreceptor glutamine deamidase CheD [Larsenimonas rhizosphaerae]MCX2523089.1 chemoreceptor glutamine deamidase CheD [Larsenimonas rhizosphaerae]